MAHGFDAILKEWGRMISETDKRELESMNLIGLLGLRNIAFESGFLHAALEYWNPDTHCFRFGVDEISPLPDEFGAILGYPHRSLVAMPVMEEYFYKDFERYFNLHTPLLTKIVQGREVNLLQFADLYCNLSMGESFHVYKRRAFIFCLLSQFVFVNGNNYWGYASLVTIMEGIEGGLTPIPTILGETMLGLDALKINRESPLRGSPILLQV